MGVLRQPLLTIAALEILRADIDEPGKRPFESLSLFRIMADLLSVYGIGLNIFLK